MPPRPRLAAEPPRHRPPVPNSAFNAASSLSTWFVDDTLSSSFWMSSTGVDRSSSAPDASSSSMAPARACIEAILSWARCMVAPASSDDVEIPDTASPTLVCASAAVYVAFSVSFCVRNCSTRACNCCEVATSFCSCSVI